MVDAALQARSAWHGLVGPGHYGLRTAEAGLVVQLLDHAFAASILGGPDRSFTDTYPLGQRHKRGDLLVLPVTPDQLFVESTTVPSDDELARAFGEGASVIDQTGSRASVRLSGPHLHDVLAKGVMIDCDARAFPAGSGTVTMLGALAIQISVDVNGAFEISCMRSVAGDLWHWIEQSAAQYGIRVLV